MNDLFDWQSFYEKTYTFVGLLNGQFYDEHGSKTEYMLEMEARKRRQEATNKKNEQFTGRFPGCNSEWTQEKGLHKVWCTKESGGVKRTWSGYPRLVYNPNTKSEGCACVDEKDLDHPNVKQYPNCDPKSNTCNPSIK